MADAILNAVEKNRIMLRKPWIVHLIPLLRGLLPTRFFDVLVGKGFRAYSTMEHFTGRPVQKAAIHSETNLKQ
ncbi:hypothetical protein ACFS7Z_03510 [Pontibacter toksunensis]|uniref:Uncharacterized protein n=1 Tax=Pontibacter toksunensis TaxID=1332631 RepID=A0ABW6BR22_9BACT